MVKNKIYLYKKGKKSTNKNCIKPKHTPLRDTARGASSNLVVINPLPKPTANPLFFAPAIFKFHLYGCSVTEMGEKLTWAKKSKNLKNHCKKKRMAATTAEIPAAEIDDDVGDSEVFGVVLKPFLCALLICFVDNDFQIWNCRSFIFSKYSLGIIRLFRIMDYLAVESYVDFILN